MSVYVLTPLAKADIFNIWSYIAATGSREIQEAAEAGYRVDLRVKAYRELLPGDASVPGNCPQNGVQGSNS